MKQNPELHRMRQPPAPPKVALSVNLDKKDLGLDLGGDLDRSFQSRESTIGTAFTLFRQQKEDGGGGSSFFQRRRRQRTATASRQVNSRTAVEDGAGEQKCNRSRSDTLLYECDNLSAEGGGGSTQSRIFDPCRARFRRWGGKEGGHRDSAKDGKEARLCHYFGEIRNRRRHGWGILMSNDRVLYEGQWVAGRATGWYIRHHETSTEIGRIITGAGVVAAVIPGDNDKFILPRFDPFGDSDRAGSLQVFADDPSNPSASPYLSGAAVGLSLVEQRLQVEYPPTSLFTGRRVSDTRRQGRSSRGRRACFDSKALATTTSSIPSISVNGSFTTQPNRSTDCLCSEAGSDETGYSTPAPPPQLNRPKQHRSASHSSATPAAGRQLLFEGALRSPWRFRSLHPLLCRRRERQHSRKSDHEDDSFVEFLRLEVGRIAQSTPGWLRASDNAHWTPNQLSFFLLLIGCFAESAFVRRRGIGGAEISRLTEDRLAGDFNLEGRHSASRLKRRFLLSVTRFLVSVREKTDLLMPESYWKMLKGGGSGVETGALGLRVLSRDELSFGRILGQGGYANVYEATDSNGELMACKVFDLNHKSATPKPTTPRSQCFLNRHSRPPPFRSLSTPEDDFSSSSCTTPHPRPTRPLASLGLPTLGRGKKCGSNSTTTAAESTAASSSYPYELPVLDMTKELAAPPSSDPRPPRSGQSCRSTSANSDITFTGLGVERAAAPASGAAVSFREPTVSSSEAWRNLSNERGSGRDRARARLLLLPSRPPPPSEADESSESSPFYGNELPPDILLRTVAPFCREKGREPANDEERKIRILIWHSRRGTHPRKRCVTWILVKLDHKIPRLPTLQRRVLRSVRVREVCSLPKLRRRVLRADKSTWKARPLRPQRRTKRLPQRFESIEQRASSIRPLHLRIGRVERCSSVTVTPAPTKSSHSLLVPAMSTDLRSFRHLPSAIKNRNLELKMLSALQSHPGVVKLHGVVNMYPAAVGILLERCSKGSLDRLVLAPSCLGGAGSRSGRHRAASQWRPPKRPTLIALLEQIATAMTYIHERGILHRDLKLSNILVDHNNRIRIADFGIATPFSPEDSPTALSIYGNVYYAAPEVLRGEGFYAASDVWSFGVVMWEALSGQLAFAGIPAGVIFTDVASGKLTLPTPANVTKSLQDLLKCIMHKDWRRRPDFASIAKALAAIREHTERVVVREVESFFGY